MNNTINAQVQGVFKLSKGNLNTNEEQHLTTFNNLILDNGLNLLFIESWTLTPLYRCSIGAGTSEPAVTDTSLTNHKFTVNYNSQGSDGNVSGIYRWTTMKYRFNPNVAGTYTEIGIGAASNNLFSKSLIKDSNGNPIAITLLPDEYLDVTYELRFYINTTESTITNFNLGKSVHTLNTKAAYINSTEPLNSTVSNICNGTNFMLFSGPVSASNTGGPSGYGSSSSSITYFPYVNNSFERSYRAVFNLNNNVNNWPIKSAFLNCGSFGLFQTEIIPDIIKTSSEILTIDYKISLGRYTGDN